MREQVPEGLAVRMGPGEHPTELVVRCGGELVPLVPVGVEGGIQRTDLVRAEKLADDEELPRILVRGWGAWGDSGRGAAPLADRT
eukprot:COSAG04_NODE_6575_length_1301_cov_1.621464_3_plen_85_part_00